MFVMQAYRTLRDRGPYPADQVLKDLDGTFGFVIYDSTAGTVFAALVSRLLNVENRVEGVLINSSFFSGWGCGCGCG